LFSLGDRNKTCMTRLDKFVEFFGGSKTLSVWAKWMFAHTIPNYRSVQTLVQAILVCAAPNIWSACIPSLLYTWNLLFSSVNSRPSLFYRSEEAKGAQTSDHIVSPPPCMCELIQVSTCAELP
jgi:hypothetical protein